MESVGALLFPALLLVGFYLLAVRPQRARLRAVQALQAGLEPGRRVMTTAGIYGTILALDDETAVLEVSPGVSITFARAALVRSLDDPEPTGDEAAGERPEPTTPDIQDPAR